MNNYSVFMSIPEIVDYLGISRYYVLLCIEDGTLKSKKIGTRRFVLRQSVIEFAKADK